MGEQLPKKLLFLEIFLRYFGERRGCGLKLSLLWSKKGSGWRAAGRAEEGDDEGMRRRVGSGRGAELGAARTNN